MATLDWQLTRAGEVTLVELLVTSDADTRVEIESALRPVWPPRRENRPAAGWDGAGFEGTVAAGEPLVLGYASPDDPVEPPATIVETAPADSDDPPTPDELVRALGDARPPRDAVPTPDNSPPEAGRAAGSAPVDRSSDDPQPVNDSSSAGVSPDDPQPVDDSSPWDRPLEGHTSAAPGPRRDRRSGDPAHPDWDRPSNGRSEGSPGEAVDTWLEQVGHRIETAQRLAAVETAEEARAAIRASGGIDEVRTLCERLDADRARMERTETRRATLDRQLGEVEVPLSALERLA